MNQNLCVNRTNFLMKGFALGLALKQRRKATRKLFTSLDFFTIHDTTFCGIFLCITKGELRETFFKTTFPEQLVNFDKLLQGNHEGKEYFVGTKVWQECEIHPGLCT